MQSPNADKFTTSYGNIYDGQCMSCKYWSPDHSTTCKAFPVKIPSAIAVNDVDHRKPYPGDNGIQWTAKDAAAKHPGLYSQGKGQ